jgi:hypothetical protein
LREYSVPGNAVDVGSYAGDEVIPSAPAPPASELTDDAIRAKIVSEIALGHAPAPTDDVIYFVIPPGGVPVLAGDETGCGGFNFTFCGYHDSFSSGSSRIRYAVLPFPCSTSQGTCFIDAASDPGHALEATGSHELAETISDPDAPPVGAGGWFDDRSGSEDGDLCASDNCLANISLEGHTFPVNSLWSNLANGCVDSAPCTTPAPACTDPAPGSCAANERTSLGCTFEWDVQPNLTVDHHGLASDTVSCADGQAFCDADATADGRCTFRVAGCLNSTDPRLVCTATTISAITLNAALVRSTDPADQATTTALLNAFATVDPGSTGAISGGTVSYTPAASTPDTCTGYVDVVVPLNSGRKGVRKLRLVLQTAGGTVVEPLKLTCNPIFP